MSEQPIIHCRHCGTDNEVQNGALAAIRTHCDKVTSTPEYEAELGSLSKPITLRATVDRTGEVLRVTCPHCGHGYEFPEFTSPFIFLCHECGQSIEVVESIQ